LGYRGIRSGLAFAALAFLLTACGSSTTAISITTSSSIHSGWKGTTFGKMALAVPKSWVVKHGTACPSGAPKGALLLAVPLDPTSCIAYEIPRSVVRVQEASAETVTTRVPVGEKPVIVNGIPVYLGFGSPTMIEWTVPELDVQITGAGPLADQVMHTLHKA
jgi:hypothetical protein